MQVDSYISERQKKKNRRRAYFYTVFVLAGIYFLLVGVLWILIRSPFFRVNQIIVSGNETVSEGDVISLLQSAALRDHNFWKALLGFRNMLIWPNSLSAADLVFVPRLASVTLSRNYSSHIITARVVERQPFAIWCLSPEGGEQCFWFDERGTIFQKTFDTQGSLMFSIHDHSQTKLGLSSKILPEAFTANMISIVNVIKESGVDVGEIALNDIGLEEVNVLTYDGPTLRFSLRFSADNDLPVLQSLMSKPSFGKLEYVDFRVENRAYYK